MRKILAIAALALMLTGCETARQDRALGGALIGGAEIEGTIISESLENSVI